MKRFELVLLSLMTLTATARSQNFVNLDFEGFVGPAPTMGFASTSNALPGWSASPYGLPSPISQGGSVAFNTTPLDASGVAVFAPGGTGVARTVLQGSYSALLAGSTDGANASTAAIAQTAQKPQGARSVVFFAEPLTYVSDAIGGEPVFAVTFAGQPISLAQIGSTSNYDIMSGDISGFAGQIGELRFTVQPHHTGVLDGIQFVPEPSVSVLLIVACSIFGYLRLRSAVHIQRSAQDRDPMGLLISCCVTC